MRTSPDVVKSVTSSSLGVCLPVDFVKLPPVCVCCWQNYSLFLLVVCLNNRYFAPFPSFCFDLSSFMSLFLNDVEPVSIPVSGGEGKDEVEDDDLAVVTFDPHPRGSRSSRKRTNFPTRHGVPHKRRRHNSPTSTLLDLGDDDDDLVVLDGPPSRVEEPVMIQSVHPTTNQPSKQPDIADLIFLESESKVSVKPTVSRPVTQVKGPHYHISDPDLSGSFGITAANQGSFSFFFFFFFFRFA